MRSGNNNLFEGFVMARARNIKPGFFRNADLVELAFEDRLLFIGLWTLADRSGRLEDRPKQIKMELFPADSVDCNAMLDSLAATGMVVRYEVGGKRFLQIANFIKHQNPHRDEKASTIPAPGQVDAENSDKPSQHCASTVQAPCKQDADTVAIGLIPESGFLIPDSLIPELIPIDASHLTPDDPSGTSRALTVDSPKIPETPKPEPPKTGLPDCPHRLLLDRWAKHLPQLTQPRSWEGNRAATMRQRWQQAAKPSPYSPKGYATEFDGLAWWDSFFEYIATGTSLATGFESNGRVWKPDLEWVCNAANFQKIIDGKYEK